MDEHTLIYVHTDNGKIVDDCGNSWTTTGSPTVSDDGITFDKSSHLAYDGSFTIGGADFTIDFWANVSSESDAYGRMFSFFNGRNSINPFLGLYRYSSTDDLMLCETRGEYSTGVAFLNHKHHFALVYQHSTTTVTIYIDGVKIYTLQRNIPSRVYSNLWVNGSNYSNGKSIQTINNFRISNIARFTENFNPSGFPDDPPLAFGFTYLDSNHYIWYNPGIPSLFTQVGKIATTRVEEFSRHHYAMEIHNLDSTFIDIPPAYQTNETFISFNVYHGSSVMDVRVTPNGSNHVLSGGDVMKDMYGGTATLSKGIHHILIHWITNTMFEWYLDGQQVAIYDKEERGNLSRCEFFTTYRTGATYQNFISDIVITNDVETGKILVKDPDSIIDQKSIHNDVTVDFDTEVDYQNEGMFALDGDTSILLSNEVTKNFDTSITTKIILKPFSMNSDVRYNVQNDFETDSDTAISYYCGSMAFEDNYDTKRASTIPFEGHIDSFINFVHGDHLFFDTIYSLINGLDSHFDTNIDVRNDKYKLFAINGDTSIDVYKQISSTYGLVTCEQIDLGKSYMVEVAISVEGAGYAKIRYSDEDGNYGDFSDYTPRVVTCRYIQVQLVIRDRVTAASLSVIPVPREIMVSTHVPAGGKKITFDAFYGTPMVFPSANQYQVKVTNVKEESCYVELMDGNKSVEGDVSLLIKR